jgi:flagellar biogenesis protein FliO
MSLPDIPASVFFVLVFAAVLAAIGTIAWLVRRFGAGRIGATVARNRQPRLAVIDAASIDGRRRLVIIRRDNAEHLLMIGGPTDVVVETNIMRGNAAATAREAAPVRATADAETPRSMSLGDGQWPSQLEPHRISVADEGGHWAAQSEQAARASRLAAEEDSAWPLQPQVETSPRTPRETNPPAGMSPEPSRPAAAELPPAISRSTPESSRVPTPSVAPPVEAALPDQGRSEMANRLKAALRRPVATGPGATPRPTVIIDPSARIAPDPRPRKEPELARPPAAELKVERVDSTRATTIELKADRVEPAAAPTLELKAERDELARAPIAEAKPAAEGKAPRPEPKPGRVESKFGPPKPPPPKTLYDSLEQEMASLLGRPAGKV